jgi:hypothetical protein
VPEGFWWRNDIPRVRAERLVAFMRSLDETYPDE